MEKLEVFKSVEMYGSYYPGAVAIAEELGDKFKLQRFSLGAYEDQLIEGKDDNGDWVRWEHVKPLLQAYLSLILKREKENENSS